MNLILLPDGLIQGIVLISGGSWGDATPEDRQFFRRFAAVVAAYERDECAKVCEDSVEYAADELARQIRARGEK
jgi:TRAP-type C4-dicarboxylate transport system substrate-binding protein